MEKIAFDVIKRKKDVWFDLSSSDKFVIAGIMGFGFLLIFGAFFHKVYDINILDYWGIKIVILICVVSILTTDILRYGEYKGNDLEVSTKLFFDENEVTFDYTEIFPLDEVTYIKFKIKDYKGYRALSDYYYDHVEKKSSGTNNHIEFRHGNKKYKFRFRIESEEHMRLLKEKLIPLLQVKTKVTYSTY